MPPNPYLLGRFVFRVIEICIKLLHYCHIYAPIYEVCKLLMLISPLQFPSEFIKLSDIQLYIICVVVPGLLGCKSRSVISGLGY